jgi:hypothetical protein
VRFNASDSDKEVTAYRSCHDKEHLVEQAVGSRKRVISKAMHEAGSGSSDHAHRHHPPKWDAADRGGGKEVRTELYDEPHKVRGWIEID